MNSKEMRSARGESLVGLLMASLMLSFIALSLVGLVSLNVLEGNKTQTRSDTIVGARFGLDKMCRFLRMARNLGDVQGSVPPTSNNYSNTPPGPTGDYFTAIQGSSAVTQAQVDAGTACNTSARFPSVANPDYSTGKAANAGPWPWGGQPYLLSADTLVAQVPVFDQNGFPRSSQSGGAGQSVVALDTYVFKVVADLSKPGPLQFYQLQMTVYPSLSGMTNRPSTMSTGVPVTLMSNIIGPIDPNTGKISCFQYINENSNYAPSPVQTNFDSSGGIGTQGYTNEQNLVSFSGIVLSFQLYSADAAKRKTVVPLRSEVYLRNNQEASLMGPPPP